MLRTFVIRLGFLVLVEHLLDLLNVLLVELLLIRLALESATKLLATVIMLRKHHVFLLNRVLCVHELILQFRVTVVLTIDPACVQVLILHQLVLQIDRPDLVVLADMIQGAAVEALVGVGHVDVLEAHRVIVVHACEVIQF